jgi:hypothetical protein
MKTQTTPLSGPDAGKKKSKEMDDVLNRARNDMKVEVRSAFVALIVGIVILEITMITLLSNLTGWTLFWVGVPGLILSALLLFVVYVLYKHKKDLELLTQYIRHHEER